MHSRVTVERFATLLATSTPLATFLGIRPERIEHGMAVVRLPFSEAVLRPGGTHSGPSLMALADIAMYGVVLSVFGDDSRPLTTQLTMDFLRRPPNQDLLAEGRLLSIDETLAVGKISVFPEQDESAMICSSTCTYALPCRAGG